MDNSTINELATNLFKTVKSYVQESFSNISKRIDILEENIKNQPLPLKGDKGDKGEDGYSVDSDLVISELESKVKALVSTIPVIHGKDGVNGKDGVDGVNGKDGESITIEELTPVIQSLIKVLPLPQPTNGKDGINGKDGLNGRDGSDGKDGLSVNVIDVSEAIKEGVIDNLINFVKSDKFIESIPTVKGEVGDKGEAGLNGKDGESVSLDQCLRELKTYVNNEDFIKLIPTIEGKQGPAGENGVNGINGKDGKDAEPIDEGKILRLLLDNIKNSPLVLQEIASYVVLPQVINGSDGKDGQDGLSGKDGINGADGKDSLEIEILDLIDNDKQYSRNTYANYNGGLVRSFKVTEPLSKALGLEKSGWHVIVNGIKSSDAELKDDNTIVFKTEFTNGESIEKQVNIPYMVYRGVWQDGLYTKNETTTWAGSLWICTTKETNTKPGEGSDWQLAVKKGRDGRDGIKGEKGERGAEGRAGKDLTQMDFNGRKF